MLLKPRSRAIQNPFRAAHTLHTCRRFKASFQLILSGALPARQAPFKEKLKPEMLHSPMPQTRHQACSEFVGDDHVLIRSDSGLLEIGLCEGLRSSALGGPAWTVSGIAPENSVARTFELPPSPSRLAAFGPLGANPSRFQDSVGPS